VRKATAQPLIEQSHVVKNRGDFDIQIF